LRPSARIWAIVLATTSASSLESRLRGVNELTIWRPRTRSISVTKGGGLIGIFATPQPQNASILPWPQTISDMFLRSRRRHFGGANCIARTRQTNRILHPSKIERLRGLWQQTLMSAFGTKRTSQSRLLMSALWGKAEVTLKRRRFRFLDPDRTLGRIAVGRLFNLSHPPACHKVLGSRHCDGRFLRGLNEDGASSSRCLAARRPVGRSRHARSSPSASVCLWHMLRAIQKLRLAPPLLAPPLLW